MTSNAEERIENRKNNFMRYSGSSNIRSNFAVSLRKENRIKLANKYRESSQDSTSTIIIPALPSTVSFEEKIKELLSINPDSIVHLHSILISVLSICTKERVFGLLSMPDCIYKLNTYANVSYPDEVSKIVLSIWTKLFGGVKLTKKAIEIIGIDNIINSITMTKPLTAEQAIIALGNLNGDGTELRNFILSQKVHIFLISFLKNVNNIKVLRASSFFFMNLSREQNSLPYEDFDKISQEFKKLIKFDDAEIRNQSLYGLGLLIKENKKRIQTLINMNILPLLFELSTHSSLTICDPALKIIGNIAFGDDYQCRHLLEKGLLDYLGPALCNSNACIRKEALYIISNIIACNSYCLQLTLDHPIWPFIIKLLNDSEKSVASEASYIFYNIAYIGSFNQITEIIEKGNFLEINNAVDTFDPCILKNYLTFFKLILEMGEKNNSSIVIDAIIATGCIQKIEKLQKHMNSSIYNLVTDILNYFQLEESDVYEDTQFGLGSIPMEFDFNNYE